MGIFVAKAIKPAKLKQDAFRLAFLSELHRVARLMKADLDSCTETWEHKPTWETQITVRGGPALYMALTGEGEGNRIFQYVDKGTRPHEIWAGWWTGKSAKKWLAFPSNFTPKTQPGVIGSSAGASGGETLYRTHVSHPGTEARRFTDVLQERWEPLFRQHMEDAMREGASKSGHGR
jgi:hypothetical protein